MSAGEDTAPTDYVVPVGPLEGECVRLAARVALLERERQRLLGALDRAVIETEALDLRVAELRLDWSACHRQHEQCMHVLGLVRPHVAGLPVAEQIDTLLERGELP